MKLATGYYPSFLLFTLYLVTLGLFAIHPAFLIAPLLVAVAAMILLSKTKIDGKLAGGVSVASYYSSGRYQMDKLNKKPIDLNYMEKSFSPESYDFYDTFSQPCYMQ